MVKKTNNNDKIHLHLKIELDKWNKAFQIDCEKMVENLRNDRSLDIYFKKIELKLREQNQEFGYMDVSKLITCADIVYLDKLNELVFDLPFPAYDNKEKYNMSSMDIYKELIQEFIHEKLKNEYLFIPVLKNGSIGPIKILSASLV